MHLSDLTSELVLIGGLAAIIVFLLAVIWGIVQVGSSGAGALG